MILLLVAATVLLNALATAGAIRIFYGRPMSMTELQALQAAITQLQTDIQALAASGVVAGAALTPLVNTVNQLDAQVKALLPPTA